MKTPARAPTRQARPHNATVALDPFDAQKEMQKVNTAAHTLIVEIDITIDSLLWRRNALATVMGRPGRRASEPARYERD